VAISLPISPAQFSSPLQPAAVLIQAGRLAEAHRLLLQLSRRVVRDPHLWLMLAWTSPSPSAAFEYYRICSRLDPGNQLAIAGLAFLRGAASIASPAALQTALLPSAGQTTHLGTPHLPLPASPRWASSPSSTLTQNFLNLPVHHFRWVIILYLLLLAASELVTTFANPQIGLGLHGFLMVVLFLHASLSRVRAHQRFLFTVALAPLIRLLSLSMPLSGFQFSYWYAIIGFPLLLSAVLVLHLTGYRTTDVGLSFRKLPLQFFIGLIGLPLGWLEYQILRPAPLIQSWDFQDVLIATLILIIFTGFLEEFIFRGLMQRASGDVLGRYGLYWTSLLFAILHIGYRSYLDFGFVLLVGLFFALTVKRTESIWGVTFAHGLTNISLYLLVPLLIH
jgi:membrane protease YdiL (CAAX protease family)